MPRRSRTRTRHAAPGRNRSRRARQEIAIAPVIVCVTGKVGWRTEAVALRRLEDIRAKADETRRRSTPARAYSCPHCGGWHLTSEAR